MQIIKVVISILIAQAAGLIGSVFTASNVRGWYTTIARPSWNPPSWVFGPVWTALFTLMGIASYIIWKHRDLPYARAALVFYVIQLILNVLWSIFFFGLKNPGLAFVEILILLALIIVTTVLFWKVKPVAGALMLPYIAWVSFASYLNYTIWRLN